MNNTQIKKIKNDIKCLRLRTDYTNKEICKNSESMRCSMGDELTDTYMLGVIMLHSNRLQGNFNSIIMKKTSYVKILSEIRGLMMNSILSSDISEKDKIGVFDVINNGINEKIRNSKNKVEYVLNITIEDLKECVEESEMNEELKKSMKNMMSLALNATIIKKLNAQMNKSTRHLKSSESKLKKQQKVEMDKRAKEEALRRVEEFAKENLGSDYHKYIQMSNNSNSYTL